MTFPATKTNAVDLVTEIIADHINNLEDKVGIDNDPSAASLDYMVRHHEDHDEIQLTPKASSTGPEGTVFYNSGDDHLYVGTE
jgi:hypothetical protein